MNNKGITMVTLVITIVIMLILAGVTITGAYSLIKKAQLENLKTNMLLIQAKTKTALEEYNFSKDESKLIGSQIQEIDTDKIAKLQKAGENYSNDWYCLKQEELNNMNLSDVKLPENEYFFVKYNKEDLTVEILYTQGFEENNKIKYTLTQLQNME